MKFTFGILILSLTVFVPAHAAETTYSHLLTKCGRYLISGMVQKDAKHSLVLVVNEKSKSEYRLFPNEGELGSFAALIETPLTLIATITKLNGQTGFVSKPEKIEPRVPNPLMPEIDTGFKLLKAEACKP